MMTRKKIAHLALAAAMCANAFSFSACTNPRRVAPADLIPSSSLIAMVADWKDVSRDESLRKVIKASYFDEVIGSLGIERSSITELAVFGGINTASIFSKGIIISGTYRSGRVIERLKSQGWTEQAFHRHKIYQSPSGDNWLASLKSEILVIGSKTSVEETIDVALDPAKALTARQPFNRLFSQASKRRDPISIVMGMPDSVNDMSNAALQITSFALELIGAGLLGDLLNKIGIPKGLSCSISKRDGSFPIEIEVIMKDESSAEFISGTLNLLKSSSSIIPQGNLSQAGQERLRAYQSMTITRNRQILSIKIDIPEKDLIWANYPNSSSGLRAMDS